MDVLLDIVEAASDGAQSVEGPLLKAKILAARLANESLATWAHSEIEGYGADAQVPDYRNIAVRFRAHFAGWDGGLFRQQSIDVQLSALPAEVRPNLERTDIRQGVRSLENLLRDSGGKGLQIPLPPGARALLQDRIVVGADITSAWLEVAAGAIEGIVSSVRSRLVDFAIAISEELGGEPLAPLGSPPPIPAQTIQNNVANIYGRALNVAIGGTDIRQVATVAEGDWDALAGVLAQNHVTGEDEKALRTALDAEGGARKSLGPKVAAWLGKLATKSAEVAVGAVTKAILGYYGIR